MSYRRSGSRQIDINDLAKDLVDLKIFRSRDKALSLCRKAHYCYQKLCDKLPSNKSYEVYSLKRRHDSKADNHIVKGVPGKPQTCSCDDGKVTGFLCSHKLATYMKSRTSLRKWPIQESNKDSFEKDKSYRNSFFADVNKQNQNFSKPNSRPKSFKSERGRGRLPRGRGRGASRGQTRGEKYNKRPQRKKAHSNYANPKIEKKKNDFKDNVNLVKCHILPSFFNDSQDIPPQPNINKSPKPLLKLPKTEGVKTVFDESPLIDFKGPNSKPKPFSANFQQGESIIDQAIDSDSAGEGVLSKNEELYHESILDAFANIHVDDSNDGQSSTPSEALSGDEEVANVKNTDFGEVAELRREVAELRGVIREMLTGDSRRDLEGESSGMRRSSSLPVL